MGSFLVYTFIINCLIGGKIIGDFHNKFYKIPKFDLGPSKIPDTMIQNKNRKICDYRP